MKFRSNRNKPPQANLPEQAAASAEELHSAERSCQQLWTKVRSGNPRMFSGLVASFSGDNASRIRNEQGGRGNTLAVRPDANGHWVVERVSYRPSLETEGMGMTVFDSVTYPLSGSEPVVSERWIGRRMEGTGSIEDRAEYIELQGPVTSQQVTDIARDINQVLSRENTAAA